MSEWKFSAAHVVRGICPVIAAIALLLPPALSAGPYVWTVPRGSLAALKARILEAQHDTSIGTHLLVEGDFLIGPDDQLPAVHGELAILGHHAPVRFIGRDGGPVNLVRVEGNGTLALGNVSIENFDLGVVGSGDPGLLVNRGRMLLNQVQFRNNIGNITCGAGVCTDLKPLVNTIPNTGYLEANQVSVLDSGARPVFGSASHNPGAVFRNAGTAWISNLQLYQTQDSFAPAFFNSGQMYLTNTTFRTDSPLELQQEFVVSPGRLQVANSVVSGFGAAWCENVISAGYNLVDNPQCGIASPEDIVGESAGLRWRSVDARWRFADVQILTHALVPIAGSPAVDSANDAWCPASSLEDDNYLGTGERPFDGDADGVVRCDRGAVEIARNALQAGGINGLFFNPAFDGHYVYIADTRYNTMVMWTTFDAEGRQAWIFGIAEHAAAGRSLIADAYVNRDGRVSLTGQFDPATSEHWGRLEVDMSTCNSGEFAFFSDTPGFGSGSFEITRLAHVKRLGCDND